MGRFLSWIAGSPFFFPPDVFERHYLASHYIDTSDSVLDVGGELGNLRKFTKALVTVVDIGKGDIQYAGKHIPVADTSYDVVTAIDVIEHVPPNDRKQFLSELVRVAKKRVIFSFPLGTKRHMDCEKALLGKLEKSGKTDKYLHEHVVHGLPTDDEVRLLLPIKPSRVWYVGDWRFASALFALQKSDIEIPIIGALWFAIKLILFAWVNTIFVIWHNTEKHADTNRAYILVEKS